MQIEDRVSEEITIIVPRLRDVSGREAMGKLHAFLRAVEIDCKLEESGTSITYAPESGGLEEGSPESAFVEGLLRIFGARLRAVPTPEERVAAGQLINDALKNISRCTTQHPCHFRRRPRWVFNDRCTAAARPKRGGRILAVIATGGFRSSRSAS